MPKEWIDVADTAVKIGLGSLISGLSTYIGLKFTKNHEIKKYSIENKTRLLEEASKDILKYTSAWFYFNKSVGGSITSLQNDDFVETPDYVIDDLIDVDTKLIESWAYRDSAMSILVLLNATDSVDLLRETITLENELRNMIVFENKLPHMQYLLDYSNRVKSHVHELNKSLSVYYETIFS